MSDKHRHNRKWAILDESGKVRARIKKCSKSDVQRVARILFPDLENPDITRVSRATPRQREIASSLPWLTPQRCMALGVPVEQISAASAGGGQ
jgi:hypothetical protein